MAASSARRWTVVCRCCCCSARALIEYSIVYHPVDVGGRRQELESEIYIWVIKPTGEVIFRYSDLNPVLRPQNMSLSDLVFRVRRSIGARGVPIIAAQEPIPARTSLDLSQKSDDAAQTEPSTRSPTPFGNAISILPTKNQPLRQLYQVLIAPIAELLPTDAKARITFIPEGPLFLIPFAALQDANGKYFVEQHTIFAAPSIQALQLTHEERQRSRAIGLGSVRAEEALVVGNPTMPSVPAEPGQSSKPLPSLPGAEKEATAIASLFNAEAIIGNEATKDIVVRRLRSARIAHFATHGLLDEVRGIGSAIVLAPSRDDDGLLTADQILNLSLTAKLVVLSACNTGRGRITGDGVIGLTRALLSRGVTSVVSSLWSIPDSPTAFLMTQFYNNLQSNRDIAQSLREAVLTTMKQHPDPKDWASFMLMGEPE